MTRSSLRLPSGTAYMVGEGGVFPGSCLCTWPYFNGPKKSCEYKMCPGSSPKVIGRSPTRTIYASDFIHCSGHGKCVHDTTGRDRFATGEHGGVAGESESMRRKNLNSQGADGGWCDCAPGWFGPDCSQKRCPRFNGTECNGQGTCDYATGRCTCSDRYFGPDCAWRHCPGFESIFDKTAPPNRPLRHSDFYECHGGTKLLRGVCNYDVGECYCKDQFYGTHCEFVRCPQYNGKECNGEGTCEMLSKAHGEGQDPVQWDTRGDTFAGAPNKVGPGGYSRSPETLLTTSSKVTYAPQKFSSFKGYGKCKCNTFHEGVACEHKKCPVFQTHTCGGAARGLCDQKTGACICNTGYWGLDCSHGTGIVMDLP